MQIINIITLLVVIYLLWESLKKKVIQEDQSLTKLYEYLGKMQVRYFESLEKHDKEFLKVFSQVFRKEVPEKEVEGSKVENDIETASEQEEISLSDTPRIPIVEGVKIKFEDEPDVMPININPLEDYQDKKQNPIEK